MLKQIQSELERVTADEIRVRGLPENTAGAPEWIRVEMNHGSWHVAADVFLQLLRKLPVGAGNEAVRLALETDEAFDRRGRWTNGAASRTAMPPVAPAPMPRAVKEDSPFRQDG